MSLALFRSPATDANVLELFKSPATDANVEVDMIGKDQNSPAWGQPAHAHSQSRTSFVRRSRYCTRSTSKKYQGELFCTRTALTFQKSEPTGNQNVLQNEHAFSSWLAKRTSFKTNMRSLNGWQPERPSKQNVNGIKTNNTELKWIVALSAKR